MIYYSEALFHAEALKKELAPHCVRIEIAGSIRRMKSQVKDIEIVCIPKPFESEGTMFQSGLAEVLHKYELSKGLLEYGKTRYTQRILPVCGPLGLVADIFICNESNWGLTMVYRTGSTEFNMKWLKLAKSLHYHMENNQMFIVGRKNRSAIAIPEEMDLFTRLGMKFISPIER